MPELPWWRQLIDRIAEVPDDQFDEHMEELSDLLDDAFESQRRGLSRRKSTKRLNEALREVKQWLAEPGNAGHPAGYFFAACLNGYLGLSPLNLAGLPQPEPKHLPLAIDLPAGATLTKNDGSSMLTLPGMMAAIYMGPRLSVPPLALLAELGAEGTTQQLIVNGTSPTEAAKMVRDAGKVMQHARVEIVPVQLGACSGKRYSCHLPAQKVHHYQLALHDRRILVTATEFQTNGTSLPALETAVGSLRLESDG